MAILYGVGQTFNVLGRVAAANLSSFPSASTSYPLTNLGDMDPATIGTFGSAVANSQLTVDGNVLLGGDFDAAFVGGAPVNFTNTSTLSGVNSRTTAAGEFVSVAALKCANGATGIASCKGLIRARPDETIRIIGRLRGDGGAPGNAAFALLRNPVTGRYYEGFAGSNTWSAALSFLASTNASAYTGSNECDKTIAMESFQACGGADYVDLELTLTGNFAIPAGRTAYFDEWYSWPVTNFAALLGIQNLGPRAATPARTWEWYSDSQSSFATQVSIALDVLATGPGAGIPSGYVKVADNNRRYNRFNFPGLPTAAPSFGEAFFGYITTAARSQNYGWSVEVMKRQYRFQSRGGQVRVAPYATYPERTLVLSFRHTARADFEELLHQWFIRSGGGQLPILVVPDDTGTGLDQMVFYGRMPERIKITRSLTTLWDWDAVVLTECPLP